MPLGSVRLPFTVIALTLQTPVNPVHTSELQVKPFVLNVPPPAVMLTAGSVTPPPSIALSIPLDEFDTIDAEVRVRVRFVDVVVFQTVPVPVSVMVLLVALKVLATEPLEEKAVQVRLVELVDKSSVPPVRVMVPVPRFSVPAVEVTVMAVPLMFKFLLNVLL